MEDDLRLYVLVRSDLGMPTGKLAVQVMHAALGVYQKCLDGDRVLTEAYRYSAFQYKICLVAKNLHALERSQRECDEAGIPTYLVEDAGVTVFSGPTVTALAIGPVRKTDLPKYIQGLQLLK